MPQVPKFAWFRLLIALTGGWLLTSCQFQLSANQEARRSRLDSVLHHLEASIATVPADSLRWITSRMNTSLEAIRMAYRDTTDTLFLSEWLLQYQQAYKELDQLPGQLRLLNKQINYSKRQLNNLKADAERGKIRPEEIDTFLIQEEKHAGKLLARADTIRKILRSALERYYFIHPQIRERI